MKATINDVARHAGVSKATVSRVLNGYQNVAGPLRERVKISIEALEYRPSAIARDLSIGHTKIIGVIMPDISDERHSMLLRGIEDRANENGYLVMVRSTYGEFDKEEESVIRLAGQNVAGLAIAFRPQSKTISTLIASGVPYISCNYFDPDYEFDSISVDESLMAQQAVLYLLALGHRNIVYMSCATNISKTNSGISYEIGYRTAMERNGLIPKSYIGTGRYSEALEAVEKATLQDNVSAIITSDTENAYAAFDALFRQGLSIPDDVSLISLGSVLQAEDDDSRFITNVTLPAYDMGATSIDMLMERITGSRRSVDKRILLPSLQICRSCGPVRVLPNEKAKILKSS